MKILFLIGAALVLAFIAGTAFLPSESIKNFIPFQNTQLVPMKLSSPAFAHNQFIPQKYTCDGDPPAGGVNPPLEISDVPPEAQSLVLIMDDPDAPAGTLQPGSGRAWVHWILWNLDPLTTQIPEGITAPETHLGMTSFGKPGYGDPCPPSGTHRYFFKLYALAVSLPPPPRPNPTKEDLEAVLADHTLAKTELIGLYRRGGKTEK